MISIRRTLCLGCVSALACVGIGRPASAQETWAGAMKAYRAYKALEKQGKYREALPHAQRFADLARNTKGPEHSQFAVGLNNLAELYRVMGQYAKAEPLYSQALEIERKVYGDQHPEVAASLNNLALLYESMGEYAKAEPLHRQALEIWKKAHGDEHRYVAQSLNNLAGLYMNMGEYAKAEPLYKQALEMRKKLLGHEHPDVAQSLNNRAVLYHDMGEYAKAERLYRQALEIDRKVYGDQHPEVATDMTNLARLYKDMGEYAKAEPLYNQALEIKKKMLGDEHPSVATSLSHLAELYRVMGQYAKAEPLCRQALEIDRKVYGDQHPEVAADMNILAVLYRATGEYGKAEPLYNQALEIWKKAHGDEHPLVATSLNNLAELHRTMGEYAKAEPLCRQALEIWKKAHGDEHPSVATSLSHLAELYRVMGQYAKAEPLCRQALEMRKKLLGHEHPNVAQCLNRLALLLAAAGRPREAFDMMTQARTITERETDMVLGFTAERSQLAFLRKVQGQLEYLLSLVRQDLPDDPPAVTAAANALLRSKRLTLDALGRQKQAIAMSGDPALEDLFRRLTQLRQQLASAAFRGPGRAGPAAYRARLASLEQQKDKLEADLTRKSAEFAAQRQIKKADVAALAAALPPYSALVDFARPRIRDFKANKWKPARYLAFVVRAGAKATPALVDLGPANTIDRAVKDFVAAVGRAGQHIEASGFATAEADLREKAKALYRLAFKPLEPALAHTQRLLICPEGQLCLLPFEAICDESGQYLLERYHFSYLSAGRDLIRYARPAPSAKHAPLILADPDFDLSPHTQVAIAKRRQTPPSAIRSADVSHLTFSPLPGTRLEAERVAKLLKQPLVRLGPYAIESALKAAQSPRILHVATHGFFLRDQDWSKADVGTRSGRGLGGLTAMGEGLRPPAGMKLENPLLRSGLALAGANRWAAAAQDGRVDDGLLTALEVSGLRLRGTDLVTLSACETGVGEVKTGEGVFGLRRAFLAAGARSLVMSLWKVPDRETVELMEGFYVRWLAGQGKAAALRDAQLSLIADLRARHGAAHPFFWAGFVLIGDWR